MNPELLTLHSRFPRIIGNSAEHGSQVGTTRARAIVGWLLGAAAKAVAAATCGGGGAVSCGVRGWLNPATQSQLVRPKCEKCALGCSSLGLACRKTPFCGSARPTLAPPILATAQR